MVGPCSASTSCLDALAAGAVLEDLLVALRFAGMVAVQTCGPLIKVKSLLQPPPHSLFFNRCRRNIVVYSLKKGGAGGG